MHSGGVVGGGPVVAYRQALALRESGVEVSIIDLEESASARSVERRSWTAGTSKLPVDTWIVPRRPPGDDTAARAVLSSYGRSVLLVQESLQASVVACGKALGYSVVWMPNDYHQLCPRSWFVTGAGERCDMLGDEDKCLRCQLTGRTLARTAALRTLRHLPARLSLGVSRTIETTHARTRNKEAFIKACDLIVAQSPSMALAYEINGALPAQIFRLNYGVAVPAKMPPRPRPRTGGEVVIAYIARPTYEKGLHLLLEAWRQLGSSLQGKAKLVLYSPLVTAASSYRVVIQRLLKAVPAVELREEQVVFRLDEVYAGIDATVQPSIWVDHHTQTVLESLARQTPVVVPRHTSFANDVVFHEQNGLCFDIDDPVGLSTALRRLVEEPGLLDRLQQHAPLRFTDRDWAEALAATLRQRFAC